MRCMPSVVEVARRFSDFINRVAFRKERFVLMRGKRPVAGLCPVPSGKRLRELPELLASLPHLSEREAEALAEDLAASRSELSRAPLRDPWAS